MRTLNKIFQAFLGYLFITGFFSCKKFVQVDTPPNLIQSGQVFSDDKTALAAVLGLYIQMRNQSLSITNGAVSVYSGLSSDEIVNTSGSATADPFSKNALLPINSTINSNFWTSSYKGIYACNAILEWLGKSSSLSNSVKAQLKGEVKLVRAFYYFYLAQLFGDVPLVLTTDYEQNSVMKRTPVPDVMNSLITDLKEAKTLLSSSYPSANRTRPNKWSATAMLVRAYLLQKDWANAEAEASELIASGSYTLVSNLNNVFVPTSDETIWQIARDVSNTAEGAAFIPSSATAKPVYTLTASLLNGFESSDGRKNNWTKFNTVAGQPYYYAYKYKVRLSSPVSEYEIVIRLAEIYLARAEARAELDKLASALDDINLIRARAGLPSVSFTSKSAVLNAVYHERQVELFCEWGDRWLSLKRWGLADTVLSVLKGQNWQVTDQLYPIPQTEIDRNPLLKQNYGY